MCHNMCHKRTMQSLCVSTFVTFVRRRGVERQQKETLFVNEEYRYLLSLWRAIAVFSTFELICSSFRVGKLFPTHTIFFSNMTSSREEKKTYADARLTLSKVALPRFEIHGGDAFRNKMRRGNFHCHEKILGGVKGSFSILQGTLDTCLTDKWPLCIFFKDSDSDEELSLCTPGFQETGESLKVISRKKQIAYFK